MSHLKLTRRVGESVIITTPAGDRITVTIASNHRRVVAMAFDAPRNVQINRAEIQQDIDTMQFEQDI